MTLRTECALALANAASGPRRWRSDAPTSSGRVFGWAMWEQRPPSGHQRFTGRSRFRPARCRKHTLEFARSTDTTGNFGCPSLRLTRQASAKSTQRPGYVHFGTHALELLGQESCRLPSNSSSRARNSRFHRHASGLFEQEHGLRHACLSGQPGNTDPSEWPRTRQCRERAQRRASPGSFGVVSRLMTSSARLDAPNRS
jgi:hypothetical protein